jgi:hypothetical protein
MSLNHDPIDAAKPDADLQDQSRPEVDEPEDPEVAVAAPGPGPLDVDLADADSADAADQRTEVPLDEERREE